MELNMQVDTGCAAVQGDVATARIHDGDVKILHDLGGGGDAGDGDAHLAELFAEVMRMPPA
jgi:hypothetical protein